jgi:hypothetical protein
MILTEHLAEEAPNGGAWIEQTVTVLDAVLVKGRVDVAVGQRVGERPSLVARQASADLLQGGHGQA